MESMSRNSLGP